MLEAFGVDPSAEAIYLAMLRQPDAEVAVLAAALGWTKTELDAALDELGRLSLLRPSWEDPTLVRPVSPAIGLDVLLARQQAELISQQHRIEDGRVALKTLMTELASQVPGGGSAAVEELVGLDVIGDGLERLAYATQHEVLAFTLDRAQPLDSMVANQPLNRTLLERGIRIRTVYLNSVRNDPSTTAYIKWLVELGAEVRTVPVLPARLLVVDRTHAVVPIDPGDATKGVAILRGEGVLAVVSALFDHVWEAATSWGTPAREVRAGCTGAGPAGSVVTDEERALLRLMLRGDTDEQVGRTLGVSTRTVRRIAAGVMDRLGARSRFQAGALAVAWGWLRPDHEPAPFG